MPDDAPTPLPERIADIARRQGGAIATTQLVALGLDSGHITRLVRSHWLRREHRGAYVVTGHPRTAKARLHVALFAYGDEAALTGRGCAVARGLITDLGAKVDVVLPTSRRARSGVRPRRAALEPGDVETVGHFRCVSVPLMLLDLAAQDTEELLARVIRVLGERDLLDVDAVGAVLARFPAHPGGRRVRRALALRDPNRGETRSALERQLSAFLAEYGFPPADRNVKLHIEDEVLTLTDFVWWWAFCALEADHRSTHSGGERFDEDRRISRRLQAVGWTTPRATGADLDDRARRDAFAEELWSILDLAIRRWWAPAGLRDTTPRRHPAS